ncbi:TolB family protein [Streptomyces sp. NPDC006463]|uniref:TolB family protein n=1 Tax=Streptomyces sp. NPDC006463 TaxID=3364746 RepID=UPI00368B5B55
MKPRPQQLRLALVVAAVLLLAGGSLGYVLHARHRDRPAQQAHADGSFRLDRPGFYFRDSATGLVARGSGSPEGSRVTGGPACDRFYAAGERALCLRSLPGIPARTQALVLDRQLREVRRTTVPGIPNRARVSASGRLLSWTTFATGDSYATSSFSTRTSILDLSTGYLIKSMEEIPLTLDGARYHAPDVNYWGVTFARDDNRFYATVSTKGRTHLVEGDLRNWTVTALRENAECPSLSPDNTRIAFKKKVSDDPAAPWRLYVLDLATMREHPLSEPHSVDDQAAWLDDATVAYALPGGEGSDGRDGSDGRASDIWAVPADGTGAPRLLMPGASSPVAVR